MSNSKKNKNVLIVIIILFSMILIGSIALLIFYQRNNDNPIVANEQFDNPIDISEKLEMEVDVIPDSEEVEYFVEDNNIAVLKFNKTSMDYQLKVTKDVMQETIFENHSWGTPITMDALCDDNTKIRVIAFIDTENLKVMKADWIDNHKFYTLITYNLNDRSEFLREANRIIIENHKPE